MYARFQQVARRNNRNAGPVLAALQAFWDSVLFDPLHPEAATGGYDSESDSEETIVITRQRYIDIFARISRILDSAVNVDGAVEEAVDAWAQDTDGQELTFRRSLWFDSIFELADVWTRGVTIAE